eukprot:240816-Prorocentrum_minimum.AAC.2
MFTAVLKQRKLFQTRKKPIWGPTSSNPARHRATKQGVRVSTDLIHAIQLFHADAMRALSSKSASSNSPKS